MRVEVRSADLKDVLFPGGLVPQIVALLKDTWSAILPLSANELEPAITRKFVAAMQVEKRRRGHKFSVKSHEEVLHRIDPATGRGYGVIDIVMQSGDDERCYFGIEAKRLNTTTASGNRESGAGEYASQPGMGCFIEGAYSEEQPHAGMVGYVMDGDCKRAKTALATSMEGKRDYLKMRQPCELLQSKYLPADDAAFETLHDLGRGEFTIFHVLLAAA